MSNVDDLKSELAIAKSQGRGTDAARVKKQLAALDAGPSAPAESVQVKAEAATSRAEAAKASGDDEPKRAAPKGRQSPSSRQHRA